MISFKSNILPTLSIFYRHKNEVDIFIEDTNDEEFYTALFENLISNKKIGKIISCGCKTKLLEACENDQLERNQNRLYIADGDLDLIYKDVKHNLKHLFVLDRYCIENFLLEEDSLIEILHDSVVLEKSKIENQLGYTNWLKAISKPLIELFIHYSLSQKKMIGLKTTSFSVVQLCKKMHNVDVLDIQKIDQRIIEFKEAIINQIGEEEYHQEIYLLTSKWPISIETLLKIVSAKDYLIPLLRFRCKKIVGKEKFNLGHESLRLRLAKLNRFESLNSLKKAILE